MRKSLPIFIISLLTILCLSGCRRASDNGKLDGLWRIDNIHFTTDDQDDDAENLFIAVNLELIQLCSPTPAITGVLTYRKGDDKIGVNFPTDPTPADLHRYGFEGNPAVLEIEHLSGSRLVLRSPIAVISCTKY